MNVVSIDPNLKNEVTVSFWALTAFFGLGAFLFSFGLTEAIGVVGTFIVGALVGYIIPYCLGFGLTPVLWIRSVQGLNVFFYAAALAAGIETEPDAGSDFSEINSSEFEGLKRGKSTVQTVKSLNSDVATELEESFSEPTKRLAHGQVILFAIAFSGLTNAWAFRVAS